MRRRGVTGVRPAIHADLLLFLKRAPWIPERVGPSSDRAFSQLALHSFRLQCERIPEYGAFASHMGKSPDRIHEWRDIPPLPASAFRSHGLSAFPNGGETVVFETSGTTISRPGRVRLLDTSLYETSLLRNFARHLLPDGARPRAVIFGPTRAEAPRSSLWFMAECVVREVCDGGSWVVHEGEPRWERADEEFERASSGRRPLLLFGTTLLFRAYFERCARERIQFRLPPGSRAMDTGGSKGAAFEIGRAELRSSFVRLLGIPATCLVNEYGMAEMGSQFYEDSFLAAHERFQARPGFAIPPWVRTRVLDPETMTEVPEGRPGFLVHYDLANLEIPLAIQTEDVGSVVGGRLHLQGRLPEAGAGRRTGPMRRVVDERASAGAQGMPKGRCNAFTLPPALPGKAETPGKPSVRRTTPSSFASRRSPPRPSRAGSKRSARREQSTWRAGPPRRSTACWNASPSAFSILTVPCIGTRSPGSRGREDSPRP